MVGASGPNSLEWKLIQYYCEVCYCSDNGKYWRQAPFSSRVIHCYINLEYWYINTMLDSAIVLAKYFHTWVTGTSPVLRTLEVPKFNSSQ